MIALLAWFWLEIGPLFLEELVELIWMYLFNRLLVPEAVCFLIHYLMYLLSWSDVEKPTGVSADCQVKPYFFSLSLPVQSMMLPPPCFTARAAFLGLKASHWQIFFYITVRSSGQFNLTEQPFGNPSWPAYVHSTLIFRSCSLCQPKSMPVLNKWAVSRYCNCNCLNNTFS